MVKRNRKTGKKKSNRNAKKSRSTRRSQRGGDNYQSNGNKIYESVYGTEITEKMPKVTQTNKNEQFRRLVRAETRGWGETNLSYPGEQKLRNGEGFGQP
jgi:hypothetical protein